MKLCFIGLLEVTELYNLDVVVFDENERIVYANTGACRLFNLSSSQIKQQNIDRLFLIPNKISDLVTTGVVKDANGCDQTVNYTLHHVDLANETLYLVVFGCEELFLGRGVGDLISRVGELQYFVLNKWRNGDSYNLTRLQSLQFSSYSALESYLFHNCFKIFLQPIVNEFGVVDRFEVLTRLVLAGKMYTPDSFLPFIERHRLVEKFDEYVLNKTISLLQTNFWLTETQRRKYRFAINISPLSRDFYRHVYSLLDIVKHSSLDLSCVGLEFEVTEDALIQNELQDERVFMKAAQLLHEHNINLAMDDFGIKNSSLERLTCCDFDVIKIDMSLVSPLVDSGYSGWASQLVMCSLVRLAADLGIELIVEGVESKELYLLLRKIGCKIFQGYYFFQPLPVEDVEGLIGQDRLDQFNKVMI